MSSPIRLRLHQSPTRWTRRSTITAFRVKSALGIFRGKETEVRIRFRPSAAPFIAEREWHETQELASENDGSVVLTMRVADTLELRRWVMSFGSEAEVLEPDSLRQEIRNEAQAILDQLDRWNFAPGQLYLPIGDFLEELAVPSELG